MQLALSALFANSARPLLTTVSRALLATNPVNKGTFNRRWIHYDPTTPYPPVRVSFEARSLPALAMVQPLVGEGDHYDGVLVDVSNNTLTDVTGFSESLQHSLQEWVASKRKGIWIKIPLGQAELVTACAVQGFKFHHAEEDYVMMTRWLPDSPSKLPANASHQVGVGAFVLNEKREVLMVQERNGILKGKGVWKMPTGLLDRGEDVGEAAVREVMEETGVRATFQAVIALRQAHGFLHGKSDLFFCVACTPVAGERELRIQEDEIEAACWMPLEEFASNPFTSAHPIFSKVTKKCVAFAEGRYKGLSGHKLESSVFSMRSRQDFLLIADDIDITAQ